MILLCGLFVSFGVHVGKGENGLYPGGLVTLLLARRAAKHDLGHQSFDNSPIVAFLFGYVPSR